MVAWCILFIISVMRLFSRRKCYTCKLSWAYLLETDVCSWT